MSVSILYSFFILHPGWPTLLFPRCSSQKIVRLAAVFRLNFPIIIQLFTLLFPLQIENRRTTAFPKGSSCNLNIVRRNNIIKNQLLFFHETIKYNEPEIFWDPRNFLPIWGKIVENNFTSIICFYYIVPYLFGAFHFWPGFIPCYKFWFLVIKIYLYLLPGIAQTTLDNFLKRNTTAPVSCSAFHIIYMILYFSLRSFYYLTSFLLLVC